MKSSVEQTNELVGVLIALAKVSQMHGRQDDAKWTIVRGLTASIPGTYSEATVKEAILDAKGAKFAISPGCGNCAAKCGNTDNFDLTRIDRDEYPVNSLKYLLLSSARNLAAELMLIPEEEWPKEVVTWLYKALSVLSYTMDTDRLLPTLIEAGDMHRMLL